MASAVSALRWVARGIAKEHPEKYQLDEDEFSRIQKLSQLELEDAKADLLKAKGNGEDNHDDDDEMVDQQVPNDAMDQDEDEEEDENNNSDEDREVVAIQKDKNDLSIYNLDNYDNDAENKDGEDGDLVNGGLFSNIKGLSYYNTNDDDPYITLKDEEDEEELENERDDLQIMPTDNLLLTARTEDNISHLEIHVYEDSVENLYVHHDILLPSYPLSLAWLDFGPGTGTDERRNFVAVGTFEPEIEIWDLDIIDALYPATILGKSEESNTDSSKKGKKKKSKGSKSKSIETNVSRHTDAIIALAANREHRNLLASGSADTTVKLWDLTSSTCAVSMNLHKDKVSSLDWHTSDTSVLLSGSYDKQVLTVDVRTPTKSSTSFKFDSDIESVRWDPHNPDKFYVADESGILYYYDIRANSHVWKLHAHNGPLSAFDINSNVKGLIATGSAESHIKLWNTQSDKPSMITSKDIDVGSVFTLGFAPDPSCQFVLAIGGSQGQVKVWDCSTSNGIRTAYPSIVQDVSRKSEYGIIAHYDKDSDSDSD